jgi:murein DD-endopeptidase MepM/ murein hydrolase activator NlpD
VIGMVLPGWGCRARVAFVWVVAATALGCASRQPAPESESVPRPRLGDFLSDHNDARDVVEIVVRPDVVYFEEGRDAHDFDFDLIVTGKTDRRLILRFIKVALYDDADRLLTYRFRNHNGMNPGIRSLGKWQIDGRESVDIYNPFHRFPKTLDISYMRLMLTFADAETREEFYWGDLVVRPERYAQRVRLHLPLAGLVTVLDGHDYYSHHRRFGTVTLRAATRGQVTDNFSRFALDFVTVGGNGHLRRNSSGSFPDEYDFHVPDARRFHAHAADVLAPGDGVVVDVVNHLPDLYDERFDLDAAIEEQRTKDIAGNLVVIEHHEREFSHLFHLMRGSIQVQKGETVRRGQVIGKLGFSGAATTYVHVHYQLMDGPDPLRSQPLPAQFDDVVLIEGSSSRRFDRLMVDTGDLIQQAR